MKAFISGQVLKLREIECKQGKILTIASVLCDDEVLKVRTLDNMELSVGDVIDFLPVDISTDKKSGYINVWLSKGAEK